MFIFLFYKVFFLLISNFFIYYILLLCSFSNQVKIEVKNVSKLQKFMLKKKIFFFYSKNT